MDRSRRNSAAVPYNGPSFELTVPGPDPSRVACCEAASARIYRATRSCRSSTCGRYALSRLRDRVRCRVRCRVPCRVLCISGACVYLRCWRPLAAPKC